jgi:AcrR family transcriptional regulator
MSLQTRMKDTRNRIFDVAMKLFSEQGFDGTQVSEIAEKAGIGKGTFFNYFPTKESLFGYIGKMNVDALFEAIETGSAAGSSVADILIDQAKRVGAWADSNRTFLIQAAEARAFRYSGPGAESENRAGMRAMLMRLIERGVEMGELKVGLPPKTAALAIEGGYFALMADWARSDAEESFGSVLTQGLSILLSGMLA